MVSWVIEGVLATSARPGYRPGAETVVARSTIEAWIEAAQAAGVRSIICLLGDDQLPLYLDALPEASSIAMGKRGSRSPTSPRAMASRSPTAASSSRTPGSHSNDSRGRCSCIAAPATIAPAGSFATS